MNTLKLRPLIENLATTAPAEQPKKEWTSEEKRAALKNIAEFGRMASMLERKSNLMELSHRMRQIVKEATELAIHETEKSSATNESWFDEQTVRKNCQEITKKMDNFEKLAKESHILEQRLAAECSDMKYLMERYYEMEQNLEEAVCKI